MPNAPATKTKNLRIEDDLWTEAGEAAEAMGTDRSAIVRAFLRWYVRRPGAELPERPGGREDLDEAAERARRDIVQALEEFERAAGAARARLR